MCWKGRKQANMVIDMAVSLFFLHERVALLREGVRLFSTRPNAAGVNLRSI